MVSLHGRAPVQAEHVWQTLSNRLLHQEFSPFWYLPWIDFSMSWIHYAYKTPLKGLLCSSSFDSTFFTSVTSYLLSSKFYHSISHFFYLVTVPYKHHEGRENYMLFKLPNLRTVPNHVEVFSVKWICMIPHCSCIVCWLLWWNKCEEYNSSLIDYWIVY